MNARQAAQLARQALLREDPYPQADDVLAEIRCRALEGDTSTGNKPLRVPARKRLSIVAELRAQGYEAWVSTHEEGSRAAWITVRWPVEEEF